MGKDIWEQMYDNKGTDSCLIKKEEQPYIFGAYDSIVEFKYRGRDGYYCDGSWYSTYDHANNARMASIIGG